MPVAAAVPGAVACGHGGMPGVPAGSLGLHAVCLVTPVCVSPPIAHVLDRISFKANSAVQDCTLTRSILRREPP